MSTKKIKCNKMMHTDKTVKVLLILIIPNIRCLFILNLTKTLNFISVKIISIKSFYRLIICRIKK